MVNKMKSLQGKTKIETIEDYDGMWKTIRNGYYEEADTYLERENMLREKVNEIIDFCNQKGKK